MIFFFQFFIFASVASFWLSLDEDDDRCLAYRYTNTTNNFHPPCSVDTNNILSLGCISYDSSPSSSQSASLIKTNIPGRLFASQLMSVPGERKKKQKRKRKEKHKGDLHMLIKNEQLRPRILHQIIDQIVY